MTQTVLCWKDKDPLPMRPITTMILLGLCLFGIGISTQAASTSTNTNTLGPAPSTKVLIRMTVLGISEGVIFGSTVNNAGESIGFTSDTVGTNDTIFTVVNPNSAHPSLYLTNGDFSSATNVPSLPKVHSRFTEITGTSQGVVVGNYASASGTRAFIVSTNGSLSHFSYPGARPETTVITGISQGTVVGTFRDYKDALHGFSYTTTNSSYNRIDEPQGIGRTHVNGISEGVIYGSYVTPKGITNGFTYSQGAYTTNSVPGAEKFTEITGYSQGSVAGNYLAINRVHGGFYYDGTNYSQADVGITGYSRIAGYNEGVTAGNFLETNGVMYYSTSTNVVNTRSIFLTTNYWQTTLAAYPPHPSTKALVKYRPPASNDGNSGVMGSSNTYSGGTVVNGGTLSLGSIIYGLGSPVTNTTNLSGASNTYSGSTVVNGGTLTLGSSNNAIIVTNGGSGTTTLSGSTNTNSFGGGTSGVTLSASGTVTLSGSNTYSGSTTINGGTVLGNGGSLGTNSITLNIGTLDLGGSYLINPINDLVFSPGITTGLLTISNSGSSDYTLGNFGSSNSFTISPGTSDTISFADYTGTNPGIALTLTPATATNPTSGAFLILPGTNTVEFLLH